MFAYLRKQIFGGLVYRDVQTEVHRAVRVLVVILTSLLFFMATISLLLYAFMATEMGVAKRIVGGLLGLYVLANWIYLLYTMFRRPST